MDVIKEIVKAELIEILNRFGALERVERVLNRDLTYAEIQEIVRLMREAKLKVEGI